MTKNTPIRLITLALLVIGIASALLFFYDYFSSPHLISREQALSTAIQSGNWSQKFLEDKPLDMKLLHKKTNNYAYIVDERTLQDIMPFCPQSTSCVTPYEISEQGLENTEYLWVITVQGQLPNILSGRSWGYVIDAETGQILNAQNSE